MNCIRVCAFVNAVKCLSWYWGPYPDLRAMANPPGMRRGEAGFLNNCKIIAYAGWREGCFIPCCLNGFRRKKKKKRKRKHNKRSSASCSKPKPKHLQASKAIPASPDSKEEQQDAHRRAPMFHSHIGAPRKMQFGLAQCGTVWCSYPHALVTAVLCHTSMRGFQSCTYISGSESRKQQEMLQEANYKETSLQTAAVAYQ